MLKIAAFYCVKASGWLGLWALNMCWWCDGADGLTSISRLTNATVISRARDAHGHLMCLIAFWPLIWSFFAKGGKSPFGGSTVLIMWHIHTSSLNRKGDDVTPVVGWLDMRWHWHTWHPAAVRVAQDPTLILAVEAFWGIWINEKQKSFVSYIVVLCQFLHFHFLLMHQRIHEKECKESGKLKTATSCKQFHL